MCQPNSICLMNITMSSLKLIIIVWIIINPYHFFITTQSICHKSTITECMNILFVLTANTILSRLVDNKLGIIQDNIVPVQPDSPTLTRDLALNAPATITKIAINSDSLFMEHWFTVLISMHVLVLTEVSINKKGAVRHRSGHYPDCHIKSVTDFTSW